jgi:hypothetical protein
MIHLIYIYLLINTFLLGGYLLSFDNSDSRKEKITVSFLLIFFGGVCFVWEYLKNLYNYAAEKN